MVSASVLLGKTDRPLVPISHVVGDCHTESVAEQQKWRRRGGVIKSLPWQRLGPYYPSETIDGGEDIHLDRRGRLVWLVLVVVLVAIGVALVAVSR